MSTSAKSTIDIFLLGRFEVIHGEQVLRATDWSRRKAAALLQRLAVERRLIKDQAIDFLWPEATFAAGANNLYRTLHALRQTLDILGPETAATVFTYEDGVLSLTESVRVDVHQFEQLCSTFLAENSKSAIPHLQQALTLYQGDLLPDDPYAEWALIPRETLRRRYREICLRLAAYYRETGNYTTAITLLGPLLKPDPTDEAIHRELIRFYALAGRRHEALRQYQTCADALAVELDLPPEPETTALYTQILNGELAPSLPSMPPPAWMPPLPVILEVERSAPLVGRKAELEALQTTIHQAWHGQGQTILLAGESGVGKTRLAYETLRTAASAGMTTLFGAAYEQEGQLPFQPFIEAFDRYLAGRQNLPGKTADPGTERMENPIAHFKPLGFTDPQQEHWALFKAALTFLINLAAQAPLILLLDDLHAADETSLRLFHYLARQSRSSPVILLATYRSDMIDPLDSPCGALLNTLYREQLSQTLNLSPLAEEPVDKLVRHLLNGEATSALVRAVFNLTEGNPFFVQEIIHALLKFDQVEMTQTGQWQLKPGAELHLPSGLSELLRARVARLGSPLESILSIAVVVGREFSFDILQNLAAAPDSTLLDALDAALAGHLLEETDNGYRFRHPLIRRALYEGLSRTRRARLHARTAETIELIYSRRPEGLAPYVEALAFHYDSSDRRDQALPYLLQAGQKAAGLYAFEVAVTYFERALALMDQMNLAEPAQRWPILEALGWWGIILADTPRTVARFEQALALPASEKWRSSGPARARVHRGAAMALITAGDADAAGKHLQAALAEIDNQNPKDAAEYAFVLYNIAQLHWHRNDYQQAFDAAQRSLAIAERLSDPIAIARAFEMLALACHSMGEWRQGLQFEAQRSALAGSTLDVTEAFDVHL
jgi:DNA-binding SARP family transcriptional activator